MIISITRNRLGNCSRLQTNWKEVNVMEVHITLIIETYLRTCPHPSHPATIIKSKAAKTQQVVLIKIYKGRGSKMSEAPLKKVNKRKN